MFDSGLFESTAGIIAGAVLFALMFGLVSVLADSLFSGITEVKTKNVLISLLAFTGYAGVATHIRRQNQGKR